VRVAQAVLGAVVGLLIAELAFAFRDGWAFQYLNIYRADPRFGVLLRPHATASVRFGGAPATAVRTNALGFRGAEWGPPADGEVLVVGDSQAFGLGVEESESFASRLGELLGPGAHVSNAAVPTFGPVEMERMLEDQIPARRPRLVIYVVNAYNAFFEADRPNTERHGELDGWAVRKETLPPAPTAFPGRSWLFGHSHLVLAARRWLHAKAQPSALGVPSEGTWRDLLGGAAELQKAQAQAGALHRASLRVGELEVLQAEQAYVAAQHETEEVAWHVLASDRTYVSQGFAVVGLADARATPGDIIDYGGEDSRPAPITAQMIRLATRMRQRALADLKDLSARAARDPAVEGELERGWFRYGSGRIASVTGAIDTALDQEQARAGELARLRGRPLLLVRAMSPMSRRVARAKDLCDRAGARLVVAVLPLDVQVSPAEWAKYGQPALDMEPSRALVTDVVAEADAAGALGLDLTDALRAAGDGAFLPRDLHLSAKGHAAVAQAIAARVKEGARGEQRLPVGGLPPGRSRAPTFTEWSSAGETLVLGSTARSCITKRIREWVGVWCTESADPRAAFPWTAAHAVRVVRGGRGETVVSRWKGPWRDASLGGPNGRQTTEVMLVAPVLPEDDLLADFYWPNGKKSRLEIRFPANLEEQTVAFETFGEEPSEPLDPGPLGDELCRCHEQLTGSKGCLGLPAQPSADCKRTYGTDCAQLLGCASGDPRSPPSCPAGQANAGALERCAPLCGPGRTCAAGQRCVDWQRGEVCLPEASVPAASAAAAPATELTDTDTPVPAETLALARAVVDAGRRATAGCKLLNTDNPNPYYDVFDECPLDPSSVADIQKAAAALEALPPAPPEDRAAGLVLFERSARFFADRTARTRDGKAARGTLPAFARLVEAWTTLQPAEKVDAYTEAVLAQYRTGSRTRGKAASFPLPEWAACKTGACL
jgi:hypothetical protein